MPGAAIRLDAELMSKGLQRQPGLAFAAWSGGPLKPAGSDPARTHPEAPSGGWSATGRSPVTSRTVMPVTHCRRPRGTGRPSSSVITRSASASAPLIVSGRPVAVTERRRHGDRQMFASAFRSARSLRRAGWASSARPPCCAPHRLLTHRLIPVRHGCVPGPKPSTAGFGRSQSVP